MAPIAVSFVAGAAAALVTVFAWRTHHATATRPAPARARTTTAASHSSPLPPTTLPLDAPPAATPPRMFRLDSTHTGRSGYLLPHAPRELRRIETGARISAQPVVARSAHVLFGSHDGVLYDADVRSGAIAWRFNTADRIYSTPLALESGAIYVGSDADRFFSLTATGTLDVALATDDDADTSAVIVGDGSLRVAAGRVLYALEPDLTVRWRLAFGGKVFSSPAALADGTVVVGSQDDTIYAIDAVGSVRWRVPVSGDVDATPAIDEARGAVYVGSDDGTLYALALADGGVRWRRPLGGYVRAGVAIGLDGTLVVGTYGPHARVVGVSRDDGTIRWSLAVPGPPTEDYGVASAAVVDREGRYAIGTPDDALWIIARDGTLEQRIAMPADVDSAPVLLEDGLIAVGCDDSALHLVGESSGVGVDAH
jgi:outer membrane protein assembly factor BamB